MFVPMVKPVADLYNMPYYIPIMHGNLWSDIFYSYPIIYIILYIGLDFVFAGLFSVISYVTSTIINNKFLSVLCPLFIVLMLGN